MFLVLVYTYKDLRKLCKTLHCRTSVTFRSSDTNLYKCLQCVHQAVQVFTLCTPGFTSAYSVYTRLYKCLQCVHQAVQVFTVCIHQAVQVFTVCTPGCTCVYSVYTTGCTNVYSVYTRLYQCLHCVHQAVQGFTVCTPGQVVECVQCAQCVYPGCKCLATSGLLPHPHTHGAKWMLPAREGGQAQTHFRHNSRSR